ncbi:MAG: phosphodiesterase [Victivallaceae bacterium]|nr:phosphodiesterase [Victivallaceae bacterium]
MKLLFFSDIHGVPATLKRLFEQAETLCPDQLVLLGDALYHGPRNGVPPLYDPRETAALLNQRKREIIAVRGNCDSEVDQMMLEFPVMADFSEILADGRRFFLTHGHRWNAANLPPLPHGTVMAHGHTHIAEIGRIENEDLTIFNPGSISLPKNGAPQSFGWFDGRTLSVRRLDNGAILSKMEI